MSNRLTKRFSIIVTKSWNSPTNCCLVYLSVHMCDAEEKVALEHPGGIRWARMVHFYQYEMEGSIDYWPFFSHFHRVKTLSVLIRRCLLLSASSPFPYLSDAYYCQVYPLIYIILLWRFLCPPLHRLNWRA